MRKGKFSNKAATDFIATLSVTSLDASKIESRTKFNFSYLDLNQPNDLDVKLTKPFLSDLLGKLKHFSAKPLAHWEITPVGRSDGNYLENYKAYPKRSAFTKPPSVPHDVEWARFRIDRSIRLAGFVVPHSLNNKFNKDERYRYCSNTFYVVFIDLEHGFYQTK